MKHSWFILAMLALVGSANAQIPHKISYQGMLTTSMGSPVTDGTYDLKFDIYDLPAGGVLQFSELHSGVMLIGGAFSVQLGSVTPLPAMFGGSLHIEVTAMAGPDVVVPATFSPRTELTSAPYALAPWATNGSAVHYSDGPVGIGTSNPLNDLDVAGSNFVYILSRVDDDTDAGLHLRASSVGSEPGGINQYAIQIRNTDNNGDFAINEDYVGGVWNPTTRLKIKNDTGFIGIGTENPSSQLDVAGTAQVTGFKLTTGAASGYLMTSDATGVASWQPAPLAGGLGGSGTVNYLPKFSSPTTLSNSLVYDTGTMVGIGTTVPNQTLSLQGMMGLYPTTWTAPNTRGVFMYHSGSSGHIYAYNYPAFDSDLMALSGKSLEFGTYIGGSLFTRMFVTNDGKVGIGTTTPANELDVRGIVSSTRAGTSILRTQVGAGNPFDLQQDASSNYIWTNGVNPIRVGVGNSEKMIITNAGNVGIGTTAPGTNRLSLVSGTGTTAVLRVQSDNDAPVFLHAYRGSTNEVKVEMSYSSPGNGGRFSLYSGAVPSENVRLHASGNSWLTGGNLGIGTSTPSNILAVAQGSATDPIADAWTTYSSRRWKENIETIKDPLHTVKRLRGVTYDWKADGKHDIGLIAEEVGAVVPEVVAYEENGVDARSVDYARLVALLIEAVKDQQGQINALRAEISGLSLKVDEPADHPSGITVGLVRPSEE